MAFLRARGEEEGESIGSSLPPSPAGGATNLSAFIDQGSEFEGKLSFKDTVRIDGCFRGEIASQNTLVVGETGEIMATVRSCTVIVSGTVTGNIFASRAAGAAQDRARRRRHRGEFGGHRRGRHPERQDHDERLPRKSETKNEPKTTPN